MCWCSSFPTESGGAARPGAVSRPRGEPPSRTPARPPIPRGPAAGQPRLPPHPPRLTPALRGGAGLGDSPVTSIHEPGAVYSSVRPSVRPPAHCVRRPPAPCVRRGPRPQGAPPGSRTRYLRRVCVCVCVCARACVRACVCVCVSVCV